MRLLRSGRRDVLGPAGFCDACERSCDNLGQAGSVETPGITCYHCKVGQFRHRALWRLMLCPVCMDRPYGCATCHNLGELPVPIEQ